MGCDIHVMIEAKRENCWGDRWVNVDNWRYNPYHGRYEDEPEIQLNAIYTGRDYELFSFLAGVRNYGGNPSFGFDRGFPEDASKQIAEKYKSCGRDAHTPGYCTLKELKEAAAGVKSVRREGAVAKSQVDRYRETGKTPDSWAQGIGCWKGIAPKYADKFEWLVWEDEVHCFDRLIAAIEERKRDVFWTFRPEDDDSIHDSEIRIVFWFDN